MLPKWKTASIPTVVFVLSYGATTVFAATLYMIPGGDDYLKGRSGNWAHEALQAVGSPLYLSLLYLPLLITPIFALVTIRALSPLASRISLPAPLRNPSICRSALWALAIASTSYCLIRLYQFDALDYGVLSAGNHEEKTIRRMALLDELGFIFFAFAYGINVIIPVLAFLSYELQGRKKSDFVLFSLSFMAFVFIIALTYSKAQILIYLILAICAFFLARSKLRHVLAVGFVSLSAFLTIGFLVSASPDIQAPPPISLTPEVEPDASDEGPAISHSLPPDKDIPPTEIASNIARYAANIGGAALHRMAVNAAYFPVLFADPEERCGIQGGVVRRVLNLSPPKCILPVKAFKAIYPEGGFVEGQQPAPASMSAYAEIGMSWAVAVMVLSGVALGILGVLGSMGNGPLYMGFIIAASSFGYYLAQVPFVASFTYPHGLIVFMIPIAILFAAELFRSSRPI